MRGLASLATELGLAAVSLKDESSRLGLPAFEVLGSLWAVDRALRERPETHTIGAASAGNHGRAACWVIDGCATLFAEVREQGTFDVLLVPVGVGSSAAAAARFGASGAAPVVALRALAVEPECAAFRDAVGLSQDARMLLVAAEGGTDRRPRST